MYEYQLANLDRMVIFLSIVQVYKLLSLLFGKAFAVDQPYFDLVARQYSERKNGFNSLVVSWQNSLKRVSGIIHEYSQGGYQWRQNSGLGIGSPHLPQPLAPSILHLLTSSFFSTLRGHTPLHELT